MKAVRRPRLRRPPGSLKGEARVPPFHSVAILTLSVVVLALSLGAALMGGGRDVLYAVPGEPEAAAPLKSVVGG
jgi:hypothetical protein